MTTNTKTRPHQDERSDLGQDLGLVPQVDTSPAEKRSTRRFRATPMWMYFTALLAVFALLLIWVTTTGGGQDVAPAGDSVLDASDRAHLNRAGQSGSLPYQSVLSAAEAELQAMQGERDQSGSAIDASDRAHLSRTGQSGPTESAIDASDRAHLSRTGPSGPPEQPIQCSPSGDQAAAC